MSAGYIEFTLANGRGTPVCFPIGSFHFTLHEEGGSVISVGKRTYHVDESYEYIVATLALSTHVSRAPDEADDDVVEDTVAKVKATLDVIYRD
jgi:hypothetical protein